MAGYLATAAKTSWCTPPEIYIPIIQFFGQIDLDPCSNPQSQVPATKRFMLELGQDAFKQHWAGKVFINPPFGRGLAAWTQRVVEEYNNGSSVSEVIMLIPAAVGTKMWQDIIFRHASAICFLKGRVKFQGADASAPMDCALVYWGGRSAQFQDEFTALGKVWVLG